MEIHIARDDQQFGPFPPDEVRRQLAAGTLLPTDLAWAEGAVSWVPLGSLPGLAPSPARNPTPPPRMSPLAVRAPRVVVPSVATAPKTSGAAVASLICGVLSVSFLPIGLLGIAAVICGHVARSKIRKADGAMTGDGMAAAGLVTGYAGIVLMLLIGIVAVSAIFFSGMALPYFSDLQSRGQETKAIMNAKLIATSCQLYAADHHGVFPRALDDLVPKYLPDRSTFVCPLSPSLPVGYDYFGGTTTDAPDKVLLMSKFADSQGRRAIAHVDGSSVFQIPPTP